MLKHTVGVRRPQRSEVVNPFAGMVYCADCGEKMYLSRRKNERPEQEHMRCSTYAKEQDKCTVHYIRTCVLNEIVLDELNKLLTMVRGNKEEFVKRVMSSSVQRKSSELTKAKKTLKQAEKRIAELIDKIIVHEPDKSSGKRVQDIEIHFRFDVAVTTISVETGKYGKKGRITDDVMRLH